MFYALLSCTSRYSLFSRYQSVQLLADRVLGLNSTCGTHGYTFSDRFYFGGGSTRKEPTKFDMIKCQYTTKTRHTEQSYQQNKTYLIRQHFSNILINPNFSTYLYRFKLSPHVGPALTVFVSPPDLITSFII